MLRPLVVPPLWVFAALPTLNVPAARAQVACMCGLWDVAALLVAKGASRTARNSAGHRPLMSAIRFAESTEAASMTV